MGDQNIHPELLTTPQYGKILKPEEFAEIVAANTTESIIQNVRPNEDEKPMVSKDTIVNFENIIGDDTSFEKALQKAFTRFQESPDSEVVALRGHFEKYKEENNDWLERKGIFEVLKKEHGTDEYENWQNETDKNLYDTNDKEKAQKRIRGILADPKKSREIEFYKFKQFIADEHLKLGRQKLNAKGLKLFGDCLIAFSKDEMWAYPKAFEKNANIGIAAWGLPALDYSTIGDPNSDSAKLLKRKVGLFAKRYDSIRFDVSWTYVTPLITQKGDTKGTKKYQGSKVLEMIEATVKEVKGADFDTKDLIHEFETGPDDFQSFDENGLIEPLKTRTKVYGSAYMNDDYEGWGYNEAFLRKGFGEDGYVLGVANHDPVALRRLAEADSSSDDKLKAQKAAQIKPLARVLRLDETRLRTDVLEFTNAKFAEPVMAKNNMVFYMDVLGRKEQFDSQEDNGPINFRQKITDAFESEYHTALQEGQGFNMMDALAKIFKARKLDEGHPQLFDKIIKFRDKLAKKGVTTEAAANEAARATLKVFC